MNCEPAIRYFFHVRRGGFTYQDTRGTWFSTPDEARTHAELIATELAPDGIWQDAWLYVVDEENQEIARIQVSRP
jgi:hypothetical protein